MTNPSAARSIPLLGSFSLFLFALGSLVFTPDVAAQTRPEGHLVLVSGSDDESTLRGFGGGGGIRIGGKIGVEADFTLLGRGNGGFPNGYLSVGLAAHLPAGRGRPRLVPFINGGYTTAFSEDGYGFYVGAGMNYWLGEKTGFRLEVRKVIAGRNDYSSSNSLNHVQDAWLVRAGLGFGRPD